MLYCEHCGAANDIVSRQCHRCGGALSSEDSVLSTASRVPTVDASGVAGTADRTPSTTATDIGQSLDLPDWLKRAAAQTPAGAEDATDWSTLPPDGFQFAPSDTHGAEHQAAPQPLPPVPTADLPAAMPDWLKNPPPAAPVEQAAALTPEDTPLTTPDNDAANTATFIAETDLPDWIRQIAAADAAKQAEAERFAAEAARQAASETRKRIVLPGEEPAPMSVSNPWLNRRESADAAQAWSATPAKSSPAQAAAPAASYEAAPIEQTDAVQDEPAPSTGRSMPKLQLPGLGGRAFAESGSRAKIYLLGAGVLLLVLILLML